MSLVDALLVALGETLDGHPAVELVDGRRALPPGTPEAAGLVGNLDVLLPLQACASGAPLGARLRAAKTGRQRAEPLGLAFSAIRTAFHFAPPALYVALLPAAAPDPAIRLHPHAPNVPDTVRAGLTVRVSGGRLALGWSEAAPVETAETRLAAIAESLRAIAGWTQGQSAPLLTPGDFPLAGLDAATLDALAARAPMSRILPALAHAGGDAAAFAQPAGSAVNFEQSCMRFTGALDSAALRKAWALVFERHAVLRSVFAGVDWSGLCSSSAASPTAGGAGDLAGLQRGTAGTAFGAGPRGRLRPGGRPARPVDPDSGERRGGLSHRLLPSHAGRWLVPRPAGAGGTRRL